MFVCVGGGGENICQLTLSKYSTCILCLLQRVNLLAMETRRLVKCNHTRKTAAFVRACVAYTFITIPSVSNVISRLNLFVLSGRVAVANGALSQGMCPTHLGVIMRCSD